MKRVKRFGLPVLLIGLIFALLSVPFWHDARAATPLTGSARATAGTGGVTKGLFVKLSAANTIVASTGVGDSVVGVCELTASANGLTRYAPAGTMTTVTSGEAISVGDLLTTGTGSKAFVLDTSDTSTQRVAAMALTAASGADEDVTCIVLPSVVEKRFITTSSTTSAADSLAIPVTHAVVAKTTGGDAEALTLADGTVGQVLTITLVTDGGGDGTLTPTTCTGFATIVFADAGDTMTLLFVDATVGWIIVGGTGVAAPPVITV